MRGAREVTAGLVLLGGIWSASAWADDTDVAGVTGTPAEPALGEIAPTASDTTNQSGNIESEKIKPTGSRVIEEIIVTAQKREENLRTVPISVSAFSGDKLEALGIDNIQDLPQITPGLQSDNLVGYSIIFLRGVGSDIFLPSADSSVATYLDGIYTPFAHALAQDLGKIKRIEVLKGPQGTLYGRNSTGGAINTITAAPERVYSGSAGVEFGNFNSRKAKAYVTGPLSNSVQFGLSAFDGTTDSYYKRPDDSQYPDFLQDRAYGAQLKVNWDITDDLAVTLTSLMTRTDGGTQQILSSLEVRPTFALIIPERDKAWEADPDSLPYGRSENEMVYGELRYTTPFYSDLKVLASHQDILTDFNVDFDGDSSPVVDFNPKNQGARYTTAEVQLLSNESSWNSERFKWILGYYYYKQRAAGYRDIELGVGEGATDPLILGPGTALNNLLTAAGLPIGIPTSIKAYFNGLAAADADAVFAQGTWNFTEQLALTLGARYQEETKYLTQSELGLVSGETLLPPFLRYAPRQTDTDNFSPKVTLNYTLENETLLFVTGQRGFKSGTYQIANIASSPEYVEPETITSYEVGIKGTLLDSSIQYAAGLFQNTVEDLQVSIISLQNGGAISFENAGKSRIRGIDGDVLVQPFQDSLPGLIFTASGAYLDGQYLEYENGSGINELGILTKNYNFKGNHTVRTPKYSYNLGVTYTQDIGEGTLESGVSYYYNDGYFFDPQNVAVQPDYTLVNARLSYLYTPLGFRVTVFGANLGNSEYFLTRFPVDFNISGNYAPPRMYGVRLEYSF